MKLECTRGFGLVEGPDGNDINVEEPFEVDEEVGEYILDNYPGMVVVEGDSSDETPTPEPSESGESDAICGAEMTDGSECERPAGECPYHSE